MGCIIGRHWEEVGKTKPPQLYTVIYDSENHLSVLFQCLGSAWPKVLPFCVFNVMLMIILSLVDVGDSLLLSGLGHKFIRFVVSFLFVSRVSIALSRFNECRGYLGAMYKSSRDLVQNVCVATADYQDQKSQEWRAEVAYRVMLFLRTSMAVLNYSTDGKPNWKVEELNGIELEYVMDNLLFHPQNRQYAIMSRSEYEENIRVPVLVGSLLRQTLAEHEKRLPKPLEMPQEMNLFSSVDACMAGFSGLRKFKSTPVPFPLVQMSRTFLFLYLFTIPLVLVSDAKSNSFAHCFAVFLMTYGFMGLEVVAIELDDPFGNDDNDFKCLALARTAFEDTYLTILDVDGQEWADFLRYRMNGDINERMETEQSWLLAGRQRFSLLMQGDTEYKREQAAKSQLEKERLLQAEKEADRRRIEKGKKKPGFKLRSLNPLSKIGSMKSSPRHSSKPH